MLLWWDFSQARTQHKHNDVADRLTSTLHEEEHEEDRPGRRERHSDAEDAEHGDGAKQDGLPAKPAAQTQDSDDLQQLNVLCSEDTVNSWSGSYPKQEEFVLLINVHDKGLHIQMTNLLGFAETLLLS